MSQSLQRFPWSVLWEIPQIWTVCPYLNILSLFKHNRIALESELVQTEDISLFSHIDSIQSVGNNKKRSHTQLDSRKQVIAFQEIQEIVTSDM